MLNTDLFNSHESQFGRAGLPMITGAYFMDIPDSNCLILKLASQRDMIEKCVLSLGTVKDQKKIEKMFTETFEKAPDNMLPNSAGYYAVFNYYLYRYILKHYKHRAGKICLWRFIKNLSDDQLNYKDETHPELRLMDYLVRICFHSRALDDLTCIFIPVNDSSLIRKYLAWIKNYFYDANYPSSLLWLYALDSSLSSLFPDEIIYLGREADKNEQMKTPDFDCEESVLLKRFSDRPGHYVKLEGKCANDEFRQIFTFLRREHKDRCLSRSGKLDEHMDKLTYNGEWEKFEDVLKFGVSDESESGCISFSDMRASTEFLNTHGKHTYLNKIQQPFFEKTKIISKKYNGRIDKFMGDNVMSVFLNDNMYAGTREEREKKTVLNNFFAIFALCRTLYELIRDGEFADSNLGLRSGITYGTELLRSDLGNEILRDFTVTGETVNLAARLEHISIQELIIHNRMYFGKATLRDFPISANSSQLTAVTKISIPKHGA